MILRQRLPAIASFILAACSGSISTPGATETITGVERFGWEQPAADAGELASFQYAIYVDEARSEAVDVSCAAGQSSGRFNCTSRLPSMSSGIHTLQVAAFVVDRGATRESARSVLVRVLKQ